MNKIYTYSISYKVVHKHYPATRISDGCEILRRTKPILHNDDFIAAGNEIKDEVFENIPSHMYDCVNVVLLAVSLLHEHVITGTAS